MQFGCVFHFALASVAVPINSIIVQFFRILYGAQVVSGKKKKIKWWLSQPIVPQSQDSLKKKWHKSIVDISG